MSILELKNIGFSYGENDFIKSLDLELGEGELVGVFGSNGSGKTTALKLASGLLKPSNGEVVLWDKNITTYSGPDRAKLISYLPQILTDGVPFTVREVVSMGEYPLSNSIFQSVADSVDMTVEEALLTVGLSSKTDKHLGELSGGELRRVFIAMTLVQGARVVLLDEPFANLDIKYQWEVLELLKTLKSDKGFSILMAVHDLNLALQFDRVVFLKVGSIVASGRPEEIITSELLSAVYDITKDLAESVHPIDRL